MFNDSDLDLWTVHENSSFETIWRCHVLEESMYYLGKYMYVTERFNEFGKMEGASIFFNKSIR